jgi:methylglutaconyl-CoA hydratase
VSFRYLRIEGAGDVRRLVLARPEVRNAFDAELISELTTALQQLRDDSSIRVLVIAADGPTFCAGADFNWMASLKGASRNENLDDARRLFDMFASLYEFPAPTVARVEGGAFGGGAGLLACCDFVVMAEDAVLAFSEVKIGLTPATIAPFVIRKTGEAGAREVFLTGMPIPAPRALEIGLANRIVPAGDLDYAVEEYAEMFRKCSPEAVRTTKRLIRDVSGVPILETRNMTAEYIAAIRVSPEGQEGMAAFLEKRKPGWAK